MYLGDFDAGNTIDFKFCTVGSTGAPTTLSGTPAILVYKGNSTTESSSTGITLTVDFDAHTGLNHVRITTGSDGTFYADGNDFQIVITAGTVGGTSVVGYVVAHFSLRNRNVTLRGITHTSAVIPTVTAVTNRVTANTDQIEGVDATNQIRDSVVSDATRFAGANIDAAVSSRLASASYTTPPTAAANADAVWDELRADHLSNGSFGQALQVLRAGTAQGGAASYITLDAGAPAVDNLFLGCTALIVSGTGAGQHRVAISYDDVTKQLAVVPDWTVTPDNTSVYILVGGWAAVSVMNNNTIDSFVLAASAITEIQSGLATQASVDTIDDFLDTEIAAIKAKTDNLPEGIKKNQALNNFQFLMTDSTTGAPKTGLTGFTKEENIDNAGWASLSGTVTEIGSGLYRINLTAGELNGDLISFRFAASGANDTVLTIKTAP